MSPFKHVKSILAHRLYENKQPQAGFGPESPGFKQLLSYTEMWKNAASLHPTFTPLRYLPREGNS